MSTETIWQPPLGYTGTRQDAEKLAIARQQMAYENSLAPRPQWEELTDHGREMSILDAANMLTAMRRAGFLTAGQAMGPDVLDVTARRLRDNLEIRLGPNALALAQDGVPLRLSGGEADDAVNTVVASLVVDSGKAIADQCSCWQPVGSCDACGKPRCWHCDPGLGRQHKPMRPCSPHPVPGPARQDGDGRG